MATSYGSISTDPKASTVSGGDEGAISNRKIYVVLAVFAGLGIFLLGGKPGDVSTCPAPTGALVVDEAPAKHWPEMLVKIDAAYAFPNLLPTTTTGLYEKGWRKTGEPCDPMLGEAWAYQGERTFNYSAAVYLTPQVGDVPGVVSGIEVDYYGYTPEKQIGTFYGEEKTSSDGSYRSISVALRNGEVENLCDTECPAAPGNPEYIMVSPGMANLPVPVTEDPELLSDWKEGSCLPKMGYHWSTFLDGDDELPYKAENLVPIQAMYTSSEEKTINGIFFSAADRMQPSYPSDCEAATSCAVGKVNFWDNSPGLLEETILEKRFFMCSNFCGDCEMTGTANEYYTTMHWFFKMTLGETCNAGKPHCREGLWAGIDPKDFPEKV